MTNINTSFVQNIFYITQAEWESYIVHHSKLNDFRAGFVIFKGICLFHGGILPHNHKRWIFNLTRPPKAAKKPSNPKPKPVPKPAEEPAQAAVQKEVSTSKKAQIQVLLERPEGATIEEMAKLTNWQNHTVRGFLSTLKKAGKTITSERVDDVRIYKLNQ